MRPVHVLMALTVMAIWGFNFVVSKFLLRDFTPLTVMAIRFALVALVLLPFVKPPTGRYRAVFLYSMVMGGLHFPLIFTGMQGAEASTASLAIQLQVPFASLLAAIFLGDRLGWRRALGMAVAFAGIAVFAGEPGPNNSLYHLGLVVLAALAFAFSNIQLKWMGNIDPFTLNAYMALFAVPQLLTLSLLLEDHQLQQIQNASLLGWLCVLYMVSMATIAAYALWTPLVKRFEVNQTMPFLLLVPLFGVSGGVLLLDEPLSWNLVVGGLLTVSGVAVIIIRRPRIVVARSIT
jgi:O-acetylserine/cysteine efflux transporter